MLSPLLPGPPSTIPHIVNIISLLILLIMSAGHVNNPARLGVLSRLPLEIRQQIYDHMCSFDSPAYEFEVEGPNNIHIPARTLELLQTPKAPRIAHVCTEMRDYAFGPATTPIAFTCYVFAVNSIAPNPAIRVDSVVERRDVKSSFRFKSDTLTFKAHQMQAVEEYDFGEGDWYDFVRINEEAWVRIRVFLFPGSGGLPFSGPDGCTLFEEFVRARRDDFLAEHPEAARALRISRQGGIGDSPVIEVIKQQHPRNALLERSYDLRHL